MLKEEMIKQYLEAILKDEFEVEIEDETVVITKEYFYHIYISDSGFLFIGTVTGDELDTVTRMRDLRPAILDIYHKISL